MTKIALLPQKINLTFVFSLALLSYTPVQAQPINRVLLVQRPALNASEQSNVTAPSLPPGIEELGRHSHAGSYVFAAPPPRPDIGAPSRRTGAGGRGCEEVSMLASSSDKLLIALVPIYSGSELVWGRTTVEHPTFWFYVPYKRPATGKFVLRDKEGKLFYQVDVTLPETPGVVSLSLPSTAPALERDKQYHWYFKIYCQSGQPPLFVDGWITRNSLNPAIERQLETATILQRVALYAANGFWYEALTSVAELRRTNPNAPEWAALLRDVGLDAIATEPLDKLPRPTVLRSGFLHPDQ